MRNLATRGLVLLLGILPGVALAQSPDPPLNLLPADGALDVEANPQLCAGVTDPQALPLDVRFFARDLGAAAAEEFTIIALPDSQYYSEIYPEIYRSQVEWIIRNRKLLNIVFVTHLGDIVQNEENYYEWVNAEAAMGLLDQPALTELPDGIPYGFSVGNHDQYPSNRAGYPEDGGTSTTLTFNEVFGIDRFAGRDYYGGNYGTNNDNSFQLFSVSGYDFIVIHHEFDDTYVTMLDLVLPWTEQLLTAHRHRRAILSSHSLLCEGVGCPSTLWAEFSVQGQLTYDALKQHENLFLMICGHAATSAQQPRRADTWDGHTIHTILANYQRFENCPFRCGNGWLRILTFRPSANEIHVQTYSPWLDEFRAEPCLDGSSCHDFVIPYDMDDGIPFRSIGSFSAVPSGSDVCLPWPGREQGGQYEWYVESWNGSAGSTGPRWGFRSDGSCTRHEDCEDGSSCTADTCVGHICRRDTLSGCCDDADDCDDDNYCTDDACVENQCSHGNNTNACSDDDPCTGGDVCANGACAGSAVDCDDANGCTEDACVGGDCVHTYAPTATCCVNDPDCDDSNPCTLDTCGAAGDCANVRDPSCCYQASDCDDGDSCTIDICPRNRGALRFDGADDQAFVGRISAIGALYGLNARRFTLECWFKWDGTGELTQTAGWPYDQFDEGVSAYPLVTKGYRYPETTAETGVNYFLGIDESGVLAADLEAHISESQPSLNHRAYGTTPVSVGVWHHAAATYDGRCWQLYLDGNAETDGTNCPRVEPDYESDFLTSLASAMYVTGSLVGRFGGLLDEVRVWNRALGPQEIVANMHEQIERAPHLMGRWGLDEIDGVVFSDSTGNEHLGGALGATLEPWDVAGLSGGTCVHVSPATVTGVQWESYPELRLAWDGQAGMTFDVAGGLISELRADGGTMQAQCLANDLVLTNFIDTRPDPPSGDGYYFIVRSGGPCEVSPYGFDQAGGERVVSAGCP